MKKLIFLSLLITSFVMGKAQTDSTQITPKNTITINGNMWKGVK
jgi:hypothetical protein